LPKIIHKQKNLSIPAFDPKNGKEIGIVSSNFEYLTLLLTQLKVFFINFHINKFKAYEEKSFDH